MLFVENGNSNKAVIAFVSGLRVPFSQVNHFGGRKEKKCNLGRLKWVE